MVTSKTKNVVILAIIAMLLLLTGFSASDIAEAKSTPAKVKISSLKAKGKTVTVKWKKAKGAKKYQVYVKAGKKTFKKVKTLKKRTYKFKGKYNTLYKVKIRGIKGKTKGKFSTIKKVRTPKSYYQKAVVNIKKLKAIIQKSPYTLDSGYHYIQLVSKDSRGEQITSRISYNEKTKKIEFSNIQVEDIDEAYSLSRTYYVDYKLSMTVGSNKNVKAYMTCWHASSCTNVDYVTTINVRDCDKDDTHPYFFNNNEDQSTFPDGQVETISVMIYVCDSAEHNSLAHWNKLLKQHDLSLYKIGWKKYK